MPGSRVAFLSKQQLHLHRDRATRPLPSEFERSVRERAASIERRHQWKSEGRGALFMGSAFGASAATPAIAPVLFTGLTPAAGHTLLYSAETDAVSGLFLLDAAGKEQRLFHTADFRLRHAALSPSGDTIAASVFHKDNSRSNIATVPLHGIDLVELTEGDSFDQCPQWVPGPRRQIVFQSAGVGRDAAGRFAGLGPCSLHRIDLDSGDVEEILAEDGFDLLQPRQSADGTLYYIRKPYESGAPPVSLLGSLKDAVLFPFRLATAIFQYFNMFTMMYTGKPLITPRGAVQRRLDPRQLFIHGNLAAAQLAANQPDETQALVPANWELLERLPNGQTKVRAKRVLAFDLAPDGTLLHTDGASIHRTPPQGPSELLLRSDLIEQLVLLPGDN